MIPSILKLNIMNFSEYNIINRQTTFENRNVRDKCKKIYICIGQLLDYYKKLEILKK